MPEDPNYAELRDKRIEKTRRYRRFMRKLHVQDSLRLLRKKPGGLPQQVVLGAQKSGTTALHKMLAQHPDMWGNGRKEMHYFNRNFHRGTRWYRTFFPPQDGRVFFDTTPCYLCHPYAAERMAPVLPDARLVVLLREPSSRALSQYWMEYMRGEEDLEIEEAFAAEPQRLSRYPEQRLRRKRAFSKSHFRNGYFWRGLYADQLQRYFSLFDRSQILVLRAEDLAHAPQDAFDRVCDFASVPRFVPCIKRANESLVGDVVAQSPESLRSELLQRYEEPNAGLQRMTGVRW